mmetsp:Transcript_6861/g.12476  ORF Transcript_6861/g.12476 Transcript_6861/m.12476 type:complete len:101 (+) Transcript_6861:295-597(+)|eukprot:CAMPEP_0204905522 /NCGR_PEP_ID=MMETSP1397-20131031/5466_1 /ASSEMBLY_ACC=CAM_ASM_000891 /TAXON_ID=49980 /ORGANISM="Climacostomum Climacostomum virens, Strain Stock W-24" /LENGTH=100 /DNA_ID=CAMNT_0052074407 /DNA_START=246 /DNA_END=548 /DNA_ORIENTATION=-
MESERLNKAQADAKEYIERHHLDVLMKRMLNSLVHSKDPQPEVFMIKYLLEHAGLNPEQLLSTGLQVAGHAQSEESKQANDQGGQSEQPRLEEEIHRSHN